MLKTVKFMLLAALVLALGLAGTTGCSSSPGEMEEGYQVGNLAPNFGLRTTDGETVSLSQFKGRPILLNFWATWCPPCRAEMPLFQAISQDKTLAAKGLVVLAVDLGEDKNTVQAYLKGNGLTFTVLLDTEQIVGRTYNIGGIPTTYFIDKDGIIKDMRIGAFANESQIIRSLNKVIQ